MKKKYKVIIPVVLALIFLSVAIWYLHSKNIAVLDPKGQIADKERNLIYISLALSLLVVIPVYTLAIVFSVRYREGNKKAKYSPDLDGNKIAETVWWLIPTAIISVLAVVAWRSSHELDPYKPIVSNVTPITIQVVALDWKWLFIYPGQNIASVNFFQFPVNTPLDFDITSDTVMNSFWIPQLGGQIYAMPGMSTQLHLIASSDGDFRGLSANISGEGFAGMSFQAKSSSLASYDQWIASVKKSPETLSASKYSTLSNPSENNPPAFYSLSDSNLYNSVIDKYMGTSQGSMQGMSM